jgi:hypothetical protein
MTSCKERTFSCFNSFRREISGAYFRIETDLLESKLAGFAVPSFEDLLLLARQS